MFISEATSVQQAEAATSQGFSMCVHAALSLETLLSVQASRDSDACSQLRMKGLK